MTDSQDSNGGTLDEVLYSGEGGLVESTCSGKTGHHVEGGGCHPMVKSSDTELFLSEGTAGTKMEKSIKGRRSSDRPKLEYSSRIPQSLTMLVMLLYACRQEPGMAAL